MSVNWLGGLRREYHHIKAIKGGHEEYESAMVLFRDEIPGRSFIIPLSALWKYLDPKDNLDARAMDARDFHQLANKIYWHRELAINPAVTAEDAAAIILAERFSVDCGLMLCTGFSLVKCCQILGLTLSAQVMAQLLLFIQDGLDDLRKLPDHEDEEAVSVGEVVVVADGKAHHHEILMTETDLMLGG